MIPAQFKTVDGVQVCRRVVFQANTRVDGWPFEMLHAVAVAKRLGVTLFEFDVQGAPAANGDDEEKAGGFIMLSFLGRSVSDDGEEWKEAKGATSKQPKAGCVVTVYAVVVE